jgi:hypothetical protein
MKHERDNGREAGQAVHRGQGEPALVAAGSHDCEGQCAPARDAQHGESTQPADGARQEAAHETSPMSIGDEMLA